jgi:diaminopimelate epimerase
VSRELAFEKWEGLGNDFLVVEEAALPSDVPHAQIVRLTDRRLGVGGDGVLFVGRTADGGPRMTVRNADGSRPEMCGNGLRCVAAYLSARENGRDLVVATDAGPRRCRIEPDGQVSIEMGTATFADDRACLGSSGGCGRVDGHPHAIADSLAWGAVDACSIVEKTPRPARTSVGHRRGEASVSSGNGRRLHPACEPAPARSRRSRARQPRDYDRATDPAAWGT